MSETEITIIGLVAVVALVAMNAFFVATEFSFVAVRRTRVEQLAAEGQARARVLTGALGNLDKSIATTQLGITVAGLALGWLGEPAIARVIEPPIESLLGGVVADSVARGVAIALAFILVTYVLIVVGELAPKAFALYHTEATALWSAAPIVVLARVFRPFTWTLNAGGRLVVKPLGVRPATEQDSSLSPDELELVIESSARAGLLSSSELMMARRALEFSDIQANQIMIPRTETVAIASDSTLEEVLDIAQRTQHTRYPVYEDDLDHVLGIIDTKDLLALIRRDRTDWRTAVKAAVAIPESVSAEIAVATMRSQQVQMLILVDEHGGTSGILTADELLYRLIGRWMSSSGRTTGESIRTLTGGNMLLSGLALVADLEDLIGADLSDGDYDTVGGFIMDRLGRIPRVGDKIAAANYEFRVLAMDARRVDRVLVVKREPAAAGVGTRPPGDE
ncbi:MAG: hemolysin family protein [Tepidiformaceae bacterium]